MAAADWAGHVHENQQGLRICLGPRVTVTHRIAFVHYVFLCFVSCFGIDTMTIDDY